MQRSLGVMVAFFAVLPIAAACSGVRAEGHASLSQADTTILSADDCLGDQDMAAADVDITRCPALPEYPDDATLGAASVSLGAWEIGTTADGDTYKYGGLLLSDGGPRVLEFEGGSAAVNDVNIACWAKGYYRLRQILKNPPREYVALRDAGYQKRFFQFQTDLRNGRTGYKKISSYMDHLVKWVTVISETGECQQPTLGAFRDYAKSELTRRGIAFDADAGPSSDAGADAGADSDASVP